MEQSQKEKQLRQILIVDDNAKYKKLIEELYRDYSEKIEWVKSAGEAVKHLGLEDINRYQHIITDITMENQISGLIFALRLRKRGFTGKITIASTGFNFSWVAAFSRALLGKFGVDEIIPKNSLKAGRPIILSCKK